MVTLDAGASKVDIRSIQSALHLMLSKERMHLILIDRFKIRWIFIEDLSHTPLSHLSNIKQFADSNEAHSLDPRTIRDQEQVSVNSNKFLIISANHTALFRFWTNETAGNKIVTDTCSWSLIVLGSREWASLISANYLKLDKSVVRCVMLIKCMCFLNLIVLLKPHCEKIVQFWKWNTHEFIFLPE